MIDIHVHCHKQRHAKLTRPGGGYSPTPERLVEMLDEADIAKAVVLCSVSPECEYTLTPPEEVLDICAGYPDRLIPFCNFDPRYLTNSPQANFRPLLEAYKELGFRGVGEYVPNLPFDDPLNMNLFAQIEEAELPVTFHIAPKVGENYGCADELGLPRLERVLRTFPNLVLLGHSQPFWAEISADVTAENRAGYPTGPVTPGRVVELMRSYPNLHGDLSAGSGFNAISRDPEFGYAFLEEFQDRLYFGTDLCTDLQETPIVDYFRKLKEERLVSAEAWEKIRWRNAARLLNLGGEGS